VFKVLFNKKFKLRKEIYVLFSFLEVVIVMMMMIMDGDYDC